MQVTKRKDNVWNVNSAVVYCKVKDNDIIITIFDGIWQNTGETH